MGTSPLFFSVCMELASLYFSRCHDLHSLADFSCLLALLILISLIASCWMNWSQEVGSYCPWVPRVRTKFWCNTTKPATGRSSKPSWWAWSTFLWRIRKSSGLGKHSQRFSSPPRGLALLECWLCWQIPGFLAAAVRKGQKEEAN